MAMNPNTLKWFSIVGVALAGGGLLFNFIPWILCYIAPFLSQAAVVLGLMSFVQKSRDEGSQTWLLSIAALALGLLALVIAALMYIFEWRLF